MIADQAHIRNFAIIAHIDHGKSTLADRLLELTGTVPKREMQDQLLDSNPIERERGITIKLAPVRMMWKTIKCDKDAKVDENARNDASSSRPIHPRVPSHFILNLIDTPGHVDFSYEVSRSLAACEGAILVVDAAQGVQAQTLSHLHQARLHNLTIIPVINKIDLPNARINESLEELRSLGFRKEEVIKISAKTGENVEQVLEAIVERIPPPQGDPEAPLRALIFSSQYDPHKGVVVFVRVVDGLIGSGETFFGDVRQPLPQRSELPSSSLNEAPPTGENSGSKVQLRRVFSAPQNAHPRRAVPGLEKARRAASLRFLASGAEVTPLEIGYFSPKMIACDPPAGGLRTGEVGYVATGLKDVRMAKVGDTVTTMPNDKWPMTNKKTFSIGHLALDIEPLPGYQEPKPMVFLGLFPVSADDYQDAREAMEKLRLSDSAFTFRPISSLALGNGFHCGFLGLLHAEVVQERILREFGLTMIATIPSVEYRITMKSDQNAKVDENARNDASSSRPIHPRVPSRSISTQSAAEFPDPSLIEEVREPVMQVTIYSPKQYIGAVMQLAQEKRGDFIDMKYLHNETTIQSPPSAGSRQEAGQFNNITIEDQPSRKNITQDTHRTLVELTYLIPLSEMIIDFFDRLKSVTEGYASLDYEFFDWQAADIVKVDILVNHEKVDALSFLVENRDAQRRSRELVERLALTIPRAQFSIPIQGALGGQIIARSDVKPFRKDVTKKLYGGDRTRKDKLLDKQKKGKAKMKMIGRVEIPQSAFFAVLKKG